MKIRKELVKKTAIFFLNALCMLLSSALSAGMIDKEGMKPWEVCGLCHSADGISRMAKFPKLAGQKAVYIEQQLIRFRLGLRQNDGGQMEAISTEVELADIAQVAAYFASLPADPLAANASELSAEELQLFARGEQIFKQGKEGVLACSQCHINKNSIAPWVDRQHRNYLKKQLEDFKRGDRATSNLAGQAAIFSDESVQMGALAQRLDDEDIDALSMYLSITKLNRN